MRLDERKIVLIDFMKEGPSEEDHILFEGLRFKIIYHRIGWDFATAEMLVRRFDGFADGIAISGIQKRVTNGKDRYLHPGYSRLMKAAARSPLYFADDVREFFAEWTIQRILKEQPQFFFGKKTLFHFGSVSTVLSRIEKSGAKISCADALFMAKVPIRLEGCRQLGWFLHGLSLLKWGLKPEKVHLEEHLKDPAIQSKFQEWVSDTDILVSFGSLENQLENLKDLSGKILLIDFIQEDVKKKLIDAGVSQVIEFIPDHPSLSVLRSRHFSILAALLDQARIFEDRSISFEEFTLQWMQKQEIRPNGLVTSIGIQRKCAFIIHALSDKDLWRVPGLSVLENAPEWLKSMIASVAARLPLLHYGTLTGAVSHSTGQEVVCDIYAMMVTPKQLLSMDEQYVYRRLVAAATHAQKRGAAMMGLGAYTKVIGDAGVTVARRSPIPITNGNSYSASTTLWAARVMVEKMGLVPLKIFSNEEAKTPAKAMVIGATGSIGRVSALLVSLVVDELVLVAPRADRLLELLQEVQKISPTTKVKVSTSPNQDLPFMDLVVTATTNQRGNILDIMRVKPGAVICDCSRPLDIGQEEAAKRPDVLVIESGEVRLPGEVSISCDIGLPKPTVYACLAETVLLAMEGRYESFSLSKQLSMDKVKEIYRIGEKHGAQLAEIQGPSGVITDQDIKRCRELALNALKTWPAQLAQEDGMSPGLKTIAGLDSEVDTLGESS